MNIKKSIKALFSMLLVLVLLTPGISVTGDGLAAEAGETVEVEFKVLADMEAVSAATLELQYDHEVLELVPNRSFERDTKVYFYGIPLKAAFHIRESAAPGNYPVTLKIIDASDANGEIVPDPETVLIFSEESVTVERAPAEVPVYYIDTASDNLLKTDTVMLPAGLTSTVNAEAPEGWTVVGGQSIQVTVSEDGQAIPPTINFWLAKTTPTPLPGISMEITSIAGSNQMRWDRVPGAERYRVYRGTSGNGSYDILATVTGESYTDSAVKGGTTYYYMVEALFPNGQTVTANKSAVAATPTPKPVKAGDYIKFGHYPQTAEGNDNTDIEWLVLEVRGNEALLISKYGLDAKQYNDSYESVTWETCSLRKWLNGEFLNSAFTAKEQAYILLKNVDNSRGQGYSGWGTSGGNNTENKVFLLSYAEANYYFSVTYENRSNTRSRTVPTAYALKQGAYASGRNLTADGTAATWWWLRSPGNHQTDAAYVLSFGSLYYIGVNNDSGCVRPALWVNLGSDIF